MTKNSGLQSGPRLAVAEKGKASTNGEAPAVKGDEGNGTAVAHIAEGQAPVDWTSTRVDLNNFAAIRDWYRRRNKHLGDVLGGGRKSPLMWGIVPVEKTAAHRAVIGPWPLPSSPGRTANVLDQLAVVCSLPQASVQALGLLNAAHHLPQLSRKVDADLWWPAVGLLVDRCAPSDTDIDHDAWAHQLNWVELPLTLGFQLPHVDCIDQIARGAAELLGDSLAHLLDHDGMPHAGLLETLPPLIAVWLRCLRLMRLQRIEPSAGTLKLVNGLMRYSSQLVDRRGYSMLAGDGFDRLQRRALESASRAVGTKAARRAAHAWIDRRAAAPDRRSLRGACSEWGALALLQARNRQCTTRFAVAFDRHPVRLHLETGRGLLAGELPATIRWNGAEVPLESLPDWECVCWHSDRKVDYLEIECRPHPEIVWQRLFLLSRSDRFLLLADAIKADEPGELDFVASYPLASGVSVRPESETREIYLERDGKIKALVLPLALNEWQTPRTADQLSSTGENLELRQQSTAGGLMAPLWIDLDQRRSRSPRTWRRLTVAEQLQLRPADVAAGYRVQVGSAQWLVYRSLAPRANRTVLGQNLSCEFYVGRFLTDGTCKELISIE